MVRTQKLVKSFHRKGSLHWLCGEVCDILLKFGAGSSVGDLVLVVLQHVIRFAPVENMKMWNVSLFLC